MKSRYLLIITLALGISLPAVSQTESLIGAGQIPSVSANNSHYELGSQFTVTADGYITAARLYTNTNESGSHVIRLWHVTADDYFLVAGPVTWNITSGTQGWREYTFNDPVAVYNGHTYIISISNGPDYYYMYTPSFSTSAPNTNIHFVSGVYTTTEGFIPMRTQNGNCYFRDIVFTTNEVNTFFGGRIGTAQTVCYNTAPSALTQTVAPARGSSYQWQSSSDGLTWSDISGETSSGYSPPALTVNTYYRREVIDGSDVSYSNSVLITVNQQFTLAQLHDNVTIASGGSASFTVDITGGSAPYTVTYSINGTPQTPITYYESGTNISTGTLTTGTYVYSLVSVTDYYSCTPSSLGSNITVTVTSGGPQYTELETLFGAEQVPAETLHDRFYELGSEFQVLADGYLSKARLYSSANEGGDHTVRLWRITGSNYSVIYGPYTWNFSSGTTGWREFTFPEPIRVEAGGTYVITISNSSDWYYTRSLNFTSTANGQYINYTRGVYAKVAGGVPYRNYGGICFFRDVVFSVTDENTSLLPGSVGTAQSICYNTVPETLTQLTLPSGGSSGYTYQWQSSSDAVSWSNISGATSVTYTPSALTANTYFRRSVTSGAEGPVYSNTVLITVYPPVASAQLHDNATIANNTATTFNVVITGGTSPYTVNYTRNGVAQTALTGYVSGTAVTTGSLTTGSYSYSLTSVTDANGCSAQSLGTGISINVTSSSSTFMEMESLFGPEQIPAEALHDRFYDHGSEFQVLANGFLTKARLYTNVNEAGDHIIRLWRVNGTSYSVVSGPYTWNFSSGIEGWREFTFPQPIPVSAGNTYVIVISNGPDFYYTRSLNFSSTADNQYINFTRGVYAKVAGGPPYRTYGGICFFRDVVFAFDTPTPGTIGSAQSVCYNSTPSALTEITAPTKGTGTYTYQWQSSANGTTWSDVYGATSSSFTPPALTENTYYRRTLTSGDFDPVYSNSILISIIPLPTFAELNGDAIIENNASTNLTATITGGTSPFVINYTRNGVAQTPVTNYTSGANISTGPLSAGIYTYSLTSVTDANGCAAQSLGGDVTVEASAANTYRYNFTYANRTALLADGWDFLARVPDYSETRNTEVTEGVNVISYDQVAHPGILRIPVDNGDLWATNNTSSNTLFRDLPDNWYSISMLLSSFNPTIQYQQAGLLIYQSDNVYVQISRTYESGTQQIITAQEDLGSPDVITRIPESATTNIYLRLDRDLMTGLCTGYYSLNGTSWTQVGGTIDQAWSTVTERLPRLAIFTGSSTSGYPNADIAWVEIKTNLIDELRCYPKDRLVFKATQGQSLSDTRNLHLSTTKGRGLTWTISSNQSWLSTNLQTGVTGVNDDISVSVNTSGLAAGVYTANLTLDSYQSVVPAIVVPVTLIVNPNVPVTATTWKDGKGGAMSVSVDDGAGSGFDLLQAHGFKGTYVGLGTTPPDYYDDYYAAGMELGSHLVSHNCGPFVEEVLRYSEIEPNIAGIVNGVPYPQADLVTLVWPCGFTDYFEQSVASEYYLFGRGYTMNVMEEATPENMMNIKSFTTYGTQGAPGDFLALVDQAVANNQWFNLVLHYSNEDGGAINYAATKDIWVDAIGTIGKYILQRDRMILNDYSTTANTVSFDVSRVAIPTSPERNFELAFHSTDVTTLQIDVADNRIITGLTVAGVTTPYTTKTINGNVYILTNVALTTTEKTVVVTYLDESVPLIYLSTNSLSIYANYGVNPSNKTISVTTNNQSNGWTSAVTSGTWLGVTPASGTGNGTATVSVNVSGLAVGTYTGEITFAMSGAYNTPQLVSVSLTVLPEGVTHYDFSYPDRSSMLAAGWDFIGRDASGQNRDTEQTSGAVVSYDQTEHPGVLRIPVDVGDLSYSNNNSRNSIFRNLPSNWNVVRMMLKAFSPTQNYQQAGLVVYETDNWYAQVSRIYANGNLMSWADEQYGSVLSEASVSQSATTDMILRLERNTSTNLVTASYSVNGGSSWSAIGTGYIHGFSNPRVGIVVGSSPDGFPDADISWIEVGTDLTKSMVSEPQNKSLPESAQLRQNYPNPFDEYTWIEYDLTEDSHVTLEVFNAQGVKVETILSQNMDAGTHRLIWTPDNYTSGTYFVTMTTPKIRDVITVTISK